MDQRAKLGVAGAFALLAVALAIVLGRAPPLTPPRARPAPEAVRVTRTGGEATAFPSRIVESLDDWPEPPVHPAWEPSLVEFARDMVWMCRSWGSMHQTAVVMQEEIDAGHVAADQVRLLEPFIAGKAPGAPWAWFCW